ncbi:type II CAAX endopeptidase family protein [Arthrobacter sp. H20]|uniref:CPBP family intramembrane glutamic endopeptidase n=1 Tax=Arthrobacter sp. H20 TaxID=1267981 RepID=UPI000478998A|nr:type II CAAX endopeptidase family protein [Arthrobacter sp. H20]
MTAGSVLDMRITPTPTPDQPGAQAAVPPVGSNPGPRSARFANPAQLGPGGPLKPGWGLWQAAAGLVLVLALPLGATLALSSVLTFGPELVFVSLCFTWFALLGSSILASRLWGFGSLAKDFGLRFKWVDLAIGLGVGIAARFILALVQVIITLLWPLGEDEVLQGNAGIFLTGDSGWIFVNAVLGGAIIAPFLEELFNRGLVLRAVQNAWWLSGSVKGKVSAAAPQRSLTTATVVAIVVSSLAFGLLHTGAVPDLRSSIYLLVGTFTVGVICGVLTVWTGRLGPAIVTHVVFNGSAIGLLLVLPPELLS